MTSFARWPPTITNERADLQAGAVEQGKRMIEREYAKPLSLEEVSRRFFYSPSYYSTLFKNTVGISFSDTYDVRLTHAKRILVSGDEPISAVAALRLQRLQLFCPRLQADAGCTPDEYRRSRAAKAGAEAGMRIWAGRAERPVAGGVSRAGGVPMILLAYLFYHSRAGDRLPDAHDHDRQHAQTAHSSTAIWARWTRRRAF